MTLLDRILRPSGKSGWTAVDIAPDGLVGVSVLPPAEMGGKPSVVSCSKVANAALDVQSLTRLAGSIGISGYPWVMLLNRKSYKILVIEEPSVRPDEMGQSVRWAIGTMLDYPVADAQVTSMKIPTAKLLPNRPPHVYAVAARNDVVAEYQQAFKQAKLSLRAIDIRETAYRNIAALIAKPGEGLAMLSVSKRGVQLTITFDGELYLDRYIDEKLFGDNIEEGAMERARERIVLQLQRSLDFVSRTLPFMDIQRLVLAPMPGESELREQIAENMSVAVESVDLGSILDISRVPQLMNKEAQSDYMVALGAALRFLDKTA